MIRKYFIALCLMSGVSHTVTDAAETIWEIGKSDRSAQEFALAPDGFKRFLAEDFGYEDKFFMLGKSVEEGLSIRIARSCRYMGRNLAHGRMENASGKCAFRSG